MVFHTRNILNRNEKKRSSGEKRFIVARLKSASSSATMLGSSLASRFSGKILANEESFTCDYNSKSWNQTSNYSMRTYAYTAYSSAFPRSSFSAWITYSDIAARLSSLDEKWDIAHGSNMNSLKLTILYLGWLIHARRIQNQLTRHMKPKTYIITSPTFHITDHTFPKVIR
jgi:hypothetical protein